MSQESSIPNSLAFLKPFIRELQSLPELNAVIDSDLLDQILRDHVAGMSATQAQNEIAILREEAQSWVKESDENGPAAWLLGYLSFPKLGRMLTEPGTET